MYDKVFVLNIPSFYKINLLNEISKCLKIYVIYISNNMDDRTDDFINEKMNFDFIIINKKSYEKRSRFFSCFKTLQTLNKIKYNELIVGGWDVIEIFMLVIFIKSIKISFILESTIIESRVTGFKILFKKLFLNNISKVYASGSLHKELLIELSFEKTIIITQGVGLINKPSFKKKNKKYEKNFLFLGRLIDEKNLRFLINIFNDLPDYNLTIIGNGYLKNKLEATSNKNIKFCGHIENSLLSKLFNDQNFLILPSISETWGLVVEEALYFNTPVIISKNCGASELILDGSNGLVIDPYDIKSTKKIIKNISKSKYEEYLNYINKNPLAIKDIKQVNCYI
jgi:glycosyltransferase involved in cell wall biosynthesis